MKLADKTAIFILSSTAVFLLAWLVYDIYAVMAGGTEGTISFIIYDWSFKYPIFTFMCGFSIGLLSGHFFWRIRDTESTRMKGR